MLREIRVDDQDLKKLQFLARNMSGAHQPAQTLDFFYQTDCHYNAKFLLDLIGKLLCRINYLEHMHHIEHRECIDIIEGQRTR